MQQEDEDLYQQQNGNQQYGDDEDDEGEDIEEDSDSDIDIITERKPEPTSQPPKRPEPVKQETSPSASAQPDTKPTETSATPQPQHQQRYSAPQSSKPGSDYPAVHTSTLDINASIPTYEPSGKSLGDLDFDVDLAENTKPWRLPGTDQTDYFNYGFDEFTWATYCLKQKNMREAIAEQKVESSKFEMMFGGGLPGMPGQPQPPSQQSQQQPPQPGQSQPQQQTQASQQGLPNPAMPGMPPMPGMAGMAGMPEMTPDMMNQLMSQMMTSGVDPSQMDFGTFMQQVTSLQQGGPAMGGMPGGQQAQQPTPGFGGPQAQPYAGGGGVPGNPGAGQMAGNQRRNQGRRW